MNKSVTQDKVEEETNISSQSQENISPAEIKQIARKMLEALDDGDERGLKGSDPHSGAPIRVYRDSDGKIHMKGPRFEVSVRLDIRKNKVCWKENKQPLASFLDRNRVALTHVKKLFPAS